MAGGPPSVPPVPPVAPAILIVIPVLIGSVKVYEPGVEYDCVAILYPL
jgi:hypothetical protein